MMIGKQEINQYDLSLKNGLQLPINPYILSRQSKESW